MTIRDECDGTPCFSATEHRQECRYFEGVRTIADPCPCHTFRQCLTSTGCDECRVYGDESCGLPVNPDEEN